MISPEIAGLIRSKVESRPSIKDSNFNYIHEEDVRDIVVAALKQAQTNAQQTHDEICSNDVCDYCTTKNCDGKFGISGCIDNQYSDFTGRKLSPC